MTFDTNQRKIILEALTLLISSLLRAKSKSRSPQFTQLYEKDINDAQSLRAQISNEAIEEDKPASRK